MQKQWSEININYVVNRNYLYLKTKIVTAIQLHYWRLETIITGKSCNIILNKTFTGRKYITEIVIWGCTEAWKLQMIRFFILDPTINMENHKET